MAAELRAVERTFARTVAAILGVPSPRARFALATALVEKLREVTIAAGEFRGEQALAIQTAEGLSLGQLAERLGVSKARAAQIVKAARTRSHDSEESQPVTGSPSTPEPQPVVAAIVTSDLGVLVGRRNDGKPPWTFIAGEVEPGESPEDAGVREVKEETGLLVRATGIIGRRVHPATGRTMIYMSATPKSSTTDVWVGDEDELAEVRWVSLREADKLLPGMFEPVRVYLGRTLPPV